jgi:hypothetical protein
MAPQKPAHGESEEQSIKARKHEMFEEEARAGSTEPKKPVKVYLQETPATPMTQFTKITLWALGVIVLLLFLAAVVTRGMHSRRPARTAAVGIAPSTPLACQSVPS